MKKLVSLIFATVMMMVMLSGCTGDGKSLYDALFQKQYQQSKTALSINYKISGEGFTEEQFPSFLNNLGLKVDYDILQKNSSDYKKQQISAKTKSTFGKEDLGIYAGMDFWLDMDLSNTENPKFIETVKYPELFRYIFSSFMNNKKFDYVQIDLFKMYKETPELANFDLKQFLCAIDTKTQKEIVQKALADITVPVTSKSIGSGKKEYTIKLTDQETMKMINESMKALAKSDYLDIIIKQAVDMNLFTKDEAVEQIDKFFEELAKINYIGEKGSVFTFVVNSNGYLENMDTTIDFSFKTKEMATLINSFDKDAYNLDYVPDATINLEISTDAKIEDMLSSMQIEFPKTTADNTLDYVQMMKDMKERASGPYSFDSMTQVDQSRQGLTLYKYYGKGPIELPEQGILEMDGTLMVPVRAAAQNAFYYNSVIYDDESQNIWINGHGNIIKIKLGSTTAYVNGNAVEYPIPVQFVGDTVYVPLDLLIDNSMYKVNWNQTDSGWAGIIEYK